MIEGHLVPRRKLSYVVRHTPTSALNRAGATLAPPVRRDLWPPPACGPQGEQRRFERSSRGSIPWPITEKNPTGRHASSISWATARRPLGPSSNRDSPITGMAPSERSEASALPRHVTVATPVLEGAGGGVATGGQELSHHRSLAAWSRHGLDGLMEACRREHVAHDEQSVGHVASAIAGRRPGQPSHSAAADGIARPRRRGRTHDGVATTSTERDSIVRQAARHPRRCQ